MTFFEALEAMKRDKAVRRKRWEARCHVVLGPAIRRAPHWDAIPYFEFRARGAMPILSWGARADDVFADDWEEFYL